MNPQIRKSKWTIHRTKRISKTHTQSLGRLSVNWLLKMLLKWNFAKDYVNVHLMFCIDIQKTALKFYSSIVWALQLRGRAVRIDVIVTKSVCQKSSWRVELSYRVITVYSAHHFDVVNCLVFWWNLNTTHFRKQMKESRSRKSIAVRRVL